MALEPLEARIIGALIEKQLATPQQYPLTANALVLACNQVSNRDPVVSYSDEEVMDGLDQLRAKSLVRFVLPSHGRSVIRYRQVLDEGLEPAPLALLALLLLRGPQTAGELRTRTERLHGFSSIGEVEAALEELGTREEPFVERLERRPGQKEERWAELLGRHVGEAAPVETPAVETAMPGDVVASLRAEVQALAEVVDQLRADLDHLRSSLGE